MAIKPSNAGLMKPIDKSVGILWAADAGDVDVSEITAEASLATLGFQDAGAITTEGVSFVSNSEEGEVYLDWNGNAIDSGESTSTPAFTVQLLEIFNPVAAGLVYNSSDITVSGSGETAVVTAVEGNGNPGNKTFVLETRIKNKKIRTIIEEASFASRGDETFANDALYSLEVTYNILSGTLKDGIKRVYSEIV